MGRSGFVRLSHESSGCTEHWSLRAVQGGATSDTGLVHFRAGICEEGPSSAGLHIWSKQRRRGVALRPTHFLRHVVRLNRMESQHSGQCG